MSNESNEESIEVQDFSSILNEEMEEFKELQQRVIAILEDDPDEQKTSKLVPEESIIPGFSHGEPPFMIIVDDGDPLVLLDEHYKCHPLPPFFEMDDACMSDDYNAIYSRPMMTFGDDFSFSMIRFVPANPDYDFPLFDPSDKAEIDQEFFDLCEQTYNEFLNRVQRMSKEKLGQHFYQIQESHREVTENLVENLEEVGLGYSDALKLALFDKPAMAIFSAQTSASSEELLEVMQREGEEDE
jgi:hypothetical protein